MLCVLVGILVVGILLFITSILGWLSSFTGVWAESIPLLIKGILTLVMIGMLSGSVFVAICALHDLGCWVLGR